MQIAKINPNATIVAQFPAGVDVEAIQHEGKLYLPVVTLGEFATKESAPTKSENTEKSASKKEAPKSEDKGKSKDTKVYTENELMDMSVKELNGILSDLDVNPDDFDGKNTNKKLRNLILKAQGEQEDDSEDEKDSDKDNSKDDSKDDIGLHNKVGDILESYDAGKTNSRKAVAQIAETLDADKSEVKDMLDDFDDDEDGDIDEWSEKFVSKFSSKKDSDDEEEDDEEEEEKPKARSRKPSKKSADDDLVEIDDLKKGDRVNVWYDDEEDKDWYKGTVVSTKGGKVHVEFDDETEDDLDPEVNTKIKLLKDED